VPVVDAGRLVDRDLGALDQHLEVRVLIDLVRTGAAVARDSVRALGTGGPAGGGLIEQAHVVGRGVAAAGGAAAASAAGVDALTGARGAHLRARAHRARLAALAALGVGLVVERDAHGAVAAA